MNIFHRLSRSPFSLSSPPRNLTKRRHRHRRFLLQHNISTTMENLPREVLSEIFVKLLAKEVAQMRCVCKPWNVLLSDSSFIKSHLHHSIQNNDEILLFFGRIHSLDCFPFTARPSCSAHSSRSPDLELANFIKPPVIPESIYGHGYGILIGSVNGLICFYYVSSLLDFFVLHIWNPSLSAMLSLPPCPWSSHHLRFGFGYDPKTDDYKIIRLTTLSQAPNMVPRGEVYSMRKGSWESISQSFPSHITIPLRHNVRNVCVNDHLCWIGITDSMWKPETIVAFNLGAQTFSELPLPDSLLHHLELEGRFNVLGVLSGKLCVMSCVKGGECEVWVMDEYGVPESWVKHHVFPPFSGDIEPYGFTSHGEFLFQVDIHDDCFGLYDPTAAKTKTFKIMSKNTSVMRFAEYVDSLVWIEPANRLRI